MSWQRWKALFDELNSLPDSPSKREIIADVRRIELANPNEPPSDGLISLIERALEVSGIQAAVTDLPKTIDFKWYLHGGKMGEERGEWEDALGMDDIPDALFEKMGRPFYEVTLHCTLDTTTGDIGVREVTL